MDRVVIGNTGIFTGTSEHGPGTPGPDYFNRENSTGLFISKPGKDVFSCNSADLLFSTDIASNGFLMVVGSGKAQIGPGSQNPEDGKITPNDVTVIPGVQAPHEPHLDNPLMVNWFIICGMGKTHGSNLYDCMGGNGMDSWDGDGPDSRGLPSGYNSLYTGHERSDRNDQGMSRKHFWQNPDVGDSNYHLSNTVITNDPSGLFWSWFTDPKRGNYPTDALSAWGYSTEDDLPATSRAEGSGGQSPIIGGIEMPGYSDSIYQLKGSGSLPPVDFRNVSKGLKVSGDFLYAQTFINTTGDVPQLDIKFFNGHTAITYQVAYFVYREKGAM